MKEMRNGNEVMDGTVKRNYEEKKKRWVRSKDDGK